MLRQKIDDINESASTIKFRRTHFLFSQLLHQECVRNRNQSPLRATLDPHVTNHLRPRMRQGQCPFVRRRHPKKPHSLRITFQSHWASRDMHNMHNMHDTTLPCFECKVSNKSNHALDKACHVKDHEVMGWHGECVATSSNLKTAAVLCCRVSSLCFHRKQERTNERTKLGCGVRR